MFTYLLQFQKIFGTCGNVIFAATDKNKNTSTTMTTNGWNLGGTTRVSTSEISRDSLSAIRSHEFSHRSPFVGWSVGRSVGPHETSRRRKLFAACARFFHREALSLSPSVAIHPWMAEIKRRINVSRADGPNVRTENPILACRVARLVRVTSFFHIAPSQFALRPPATSLSILRPRPTPPYK